MMYYAPTTTYPLPEPRIVPANVDSVWPVIVDLANAQQLTIKLLDRTSGVLQTERMWTEAASQWWDCGEMRGNGIVYAVADDQGIPVTVTITAIPQGRDVTQVRITANVGQTLTPNGLQTVVARCRSKGVFEAGLLDTIASRASGR